ncbi:hypothetical protein R3P38DRAFT_3240326 [Favolaschia claudopus]|uniref:Uncharacterized protein n=1 Tax=Favolaschia claudopus TaxID=2862362 RepID=A0AAV9Z779_9AGAR
MASSDEHQSKIIVDGHHCERLWVNSEDDFLTGPQRVEMPAGSRHDVLAPHNDLETTLAGLRTRLRNLHTTDNAMEGMASTMHDIFTAIRTDKIQHFEHANASSDHQDASGVNDDASSAAVDDHASDAGDADEEGSENGDKPANAAAASEYASAASQYAADMAEIDAAELAWTRLMATLRKLDNLKGRTDGMIRDEMYVVLHELEAMQGTFL